LGICISTDGHMCKQYRDSAHSLFLGNGLPTICDVSSVGLCTECVPASSCLQCFLQFRLAVLSLI